MMRAILAAVLCAHAGVAAAQKVYVCNGPQGKIYQTMQCPAEQDSGESRKLVKDPKLSWQERDRNARALEAARRRMQADAGRSPYRQPTPGTAVIGAARDPAACEQAKARQSYTQALAGEARAKAMDSAVRDACKQ